MPSLRRGFLLLLILGISSTLLHSQGIPPSDPQAVAFAAQSIAALTNGNVVKDVTLTGSVTWSAGNGSHTGTATLLALGAGESRIDLALPRGTRTEIRDISTGIPLGKWIGESGKTGAVAYHNCMTDAVWFFPALGSLSAGNNIVLSYIGPETRNGSSVQHIRSYMYQAGPTTLPDPLSQQLSTMDFYLDAATMVPFSVVFNTHPDGNASVNISNEIEFSNYQLVSGILVPFRIQKYLSGTLIADLSVSSAVFNSGIPISDFSAQ